MSSNKDATKIIKKNKVVETDSDNDIVKKHVDASNNIKSDKDIKIKKKFNGRPKREDIYKKEREEILNKLNKILGVTEDNNKFFLWDIDNNEEIQKSILELKTDVEKYFRCSGWNFFSKSLHDDRKYISLMKSLYKEFKYELYTKTILITRNNIKIKTQQYILIKSDNN